MTDQIVLGSGKLYMMAFPTNGEMPDSNTIETAQNQVGYIQGGASLEYTPTELQIADDSGTFIRRYLTSEEVTFQSGVLTWDLDVLSKICAAGSYEDDGEGTRTLKLGGAGAREMEKWIIHFVHQKDSTNTIKITLVGTASNGFSLAFAADAQTVIDAQFKAISQDTDGTQVIVTESYTPDAA